MYSRIPLQRSITVLSSFILLHGFLNAQRIAPTGYSSGTKVNYVRSWDAVIPMTDPVKINSSIHIDSFKMSTQYFDGLGRPLQSVIRQGSMITGSSPVDMVSAVEYDSFGREPYKYLPFAANGTGSNTHISDGLFKLNPFQQDSTFNKGIFSDEAYYYSKTVFETSSLNRGLENFAPGNSWVGTSSQTIDSSRRSIKIKMWVNTGADSVRVWNVAAASGGFGAYTSSSIYAAGQLYKTVTIDEHYKQVIEFKDKTGSVVLKKIQLTASIDTGTGKNHTGWLCTYYVYDDRHQLRCVIQPKGVEVLAAAAGWDISYSGGVLLNEQCFRYEYDDKGRIIMKKIPGSGIIYLIYDARDRLVMSQDSLLRSVNKWMYTVYDGLNRPIITGLITDNNNAAYHRDHANTSIAWPDPGSYTNEELTRTFYDDYSWRSGEGNPLKDTRSTTNDSYLITASNATWPYPQAVSQSSHLKGLVTGTKAKVVGTSSYLYTISFYDEKARVVQTQNTNISGDSTIITTQYSFAGQSLLTVVRDGKGGSNSQISVILTKFTYDDLGRIIKGEKKISNSNVNSGNMPSNWTTILQNEYNALGQLKKKKLGAAPLDSLAYEYNIRGWMLGMNRSYVKDTTSTANLFGFDLGYEKTSFSVNGSSKNYTVAQYNGNITGMLWKSTGDDQLRKYDFAYDAANRLTGADFNQLTNNSFSKNSGIDFSVSGLAYDVNGNITSMKQQGWKAASSVTIDSLIYTYISNSNKLLKVVDGISSNNKLNDFYDGSNGTNDDYTYNANGDLITDNNKDITLILYNHLNLPDSIRIKSKGTIKYTYDALGTKLKKVTVDSTGTSVKTTTTVYLFGNFVNDTLQYLPQEEGRVRFNMSNNSLAYDYFIKDHLGNVRMVITEQKDTSVYPKVTFENGNTTIEQTYYENVTVGKTARPGGFYSQATNGDSVQLVRSSTTRIGAGKLLKVMAKDRLHIVVDYYIANETTDNSSANGVNSIIALLSSLIDNTGVTTALHGSGSTITSNLNNATPFTDFLAPQGTGQSSSMPKAYLNILFFDEQFRFVSANSEIIQVSTKGSGQTIARVSGSAKEAVKNGYVYVFVSNESNNLVYFDNLVITHERGPITEDTHYYPFGLVMEGISSKALSFGTPNNNFKYNGKEEQSQEFHDGSGLESYDYGARTYDVQIGRWWQPDPLAEKYLPASPYNYCLNNPISLLDYDGRDAIITVDFDKKTITISSTIYFKGGSKEDRQRYADLSNAFVKDNPVLFSGRVDGGWMIGIDIHYEDIGDIKQKDIGEGNNVLDLSTLEQDGFSQTNSGESKEGYFEDGKFHETGSVRAASTYGKMRSDSKNNPGLVVVHETFHFLGLSDQYRQGDFRPYPGFQNDLMGYPRSKDLRISAAHWNDWGNYIYNQVQDQQQKSQSPVQFILKYMVDENLWYKNK